MNWTISDHRYMSRALQLARRGMYTTHPNPRVGCVVVKDDKIVGEGWHEYVGGPHAEVNALGQAGERSTGADCYVTLEPCNHTGRTPPCTGALMKAQVSRVIAAMVDPNPKVAGQGMETLRNNGIEVDAGLLEAESAKINPGFIKRMSQGMPYVRCKLAMSLDGRTALNNGESKWITGPDARKDVQILRAKSSVVMTGIGTVLSDDPQLNVREVEGYDRQPYRIIIDRKLRCPASARILQPPGRAIIFTAKEDKQQAALEQAGAEVVVINSEEDSFLSDVLRYLAGEKEVNEVLLESGAGLAGSMLRQGLIDEMVLYQAPVLLGDRAKGLFHLPGLKTMNDKIELDLIEQRMIGRDTKITLKVKSEE